MVNVLQDTENIKSDFSKEGFNFWLLYEMVRWEFIFIVRRLPGKCANKFCISEVNID